MRKLKNNKGFTLVEMLACVVTLLLIGLIVSTGTNLAMMSLRESTFESDSQMLEATLNTYIGDILRHATDIDDSGTEMIFTNDAYYIDGGAFVVDTSNSQVSGAGYLMCTSNLNGDSKGLMVANKGVYVNNLYVTDFKVSYDKTKHVFTGNYTIVSSNTNATKYCEFSFRSIADVSVTE